ncbi:MAG: phosphotransferase [Alicyclobacillus sp.]|nr:phosphotransferase [Alicyclobacillus sp.]
MLTASNHSRLFDWWTDDPGDPGRMLLNDPDVQNLVKQISSVSKATDLGGTMSLNVRIEPEDLVLRIHQPFVSRQRLMALQELRLGCMNQGLIVPVPVSLNGSLLFRCRNRWAELEKYIQHERLKPSLDSYIWLFHEMGVLHRTLAALDVTVPRPLVATYATPATLRRWQQITETAVQGDSEATEIAHLLDKLVRRLRHQWVSSSEIPVQLVHGDVRLSNVCRGVDGTTVFFDFGFAAQRPRIHDLAYALAFMILVQGGYDEPDKYEWQDVERLVSEYESAAASRLTALEKRALAPYTAAVPMYQAAIAGLSNDSAQQLCAKRHFLRLSEWILAHPDALMG